MHWHQTTGLLYVNLLCSHGNIGLYAFGMKSDITSVDYSIPSENVEFISEYLKCRQILLLRNIMAALVLNIVYPLKWCE